MFHKQPCHLLKQLSLAKFSWGSSAVRVRVPLLAPRHLSEGRDGIHGAPIESLEMSQNCPQAVDLMNSELQD
jgi:hypothetical protein